MVEPMTDLPTYHGTCPYCASAVSCITRDGLTYARCSHRGCGARGPYHRDLIRAVEWFTGKPHPSRAASEPCGYCGDTRGQCEPPGCDATKVPALGHAEARAGVLPPTRDRVSPSDGNIGEPSGSEPQKVPHAEASDRALTALAAMTREETLRTFIDAGIVDEDGRLTDAYRSTIEPPQVDAGLCEACDGSGYANARAAVAGARTCLKCNGTGRKGER